MTEEEIRKRKESANQYRNKTSTTSRTSTVSTPTVTVSSSDIAARKIAANIARTGGDYATDRTAKISTAENMRRHGYTNDFNERRLEYTKNRATAYLNRSDEERAQERLYNQLQAYQKSLDARKNTRFETSDAKSRKRLTELNKHLEEELKSAYKDVYGTDVGFTEWAKTAADRGMTGFTGGTWNLVGMVGNTVSNALTQAKRGLTGDYNPKKMLENDNSREMQVMYNQWETFNKQVQEYVDKGDPAQADKYRAKAKELEKKMWDYTRSKDPTYGEWKAYNTVNALPTKAADFVIGRLAGVDKWMDEYMAGRKLDENDPMWKVYTSYKNAVQASNSLPENDPARYKYKQYADQLYERLESMWMDYNGGRYMNTDKGLAASMMERANKDSDIIQQRYQNALGYQQMTASGSGKGWEIAGDVITGTVQALPYAALGFAGAAATAGGTIANLAPHTTGVLSKVGNILSAYSKSPDFWLSFAQEAGSTYKEAMDAGTNSDVAALTSTIVGLINGAIEIGVPGESMGGIQGLPEQLIKNAEEAAAQKAAKGVTAEQIKKISSNKTWNAVKAWVESALGEGKEEILQGIISNLAQKVAVETNVYSKEAKLNTTLQNYGGNVDITNRQVLKAGDLAKYDWNDFTPESQDDVTLYSMEFRASDFGGSSDEAIVITPILPDGTVFRSRKEIEDYVASLYNPRTGSFDVSKDTKGITLGVFDNPALAEKFANAAHEANQGTAGGRQKWFGEGGVIDPQALGKEGLMGMAIGGLLGGTQSGGAAIYNNAVQNQVNAANASLGAQFSDKADTIIESALAMPTETRSRQLALELKNKGEHTDAEIGELYRAVLADKGVNEMSHSAIIKGAQERLEELGETGDTRQIAEIIATMMSNKPLTQEQEQIFKNSKYGQRVALEYNFADSDKYTGDWAKPIRQENEERYINAKPNLSEEERAAEIEESRNPSNPEVTDKNFDEVVDKISARYGENANVFKEAAKSVEPEDVRDFDTAFNTAYTLAKNGLDLQNIEDAMRSRANPMQYTLSYEQMKLAYETGVKASVNQQGQVFNKNAAVKLEGMTAEQFRTKINDKQNAAFKALRKLAKLTGVDIVLYESQLDENGKYVGYQGKYENGKIYLDINAGLDEAADRENLAKYAIMRVASHEYTHYLQRNASEEYEALKNAVFENLQKFMLKGRYNTADAWVKSKIAESGGKLSYDDAVDECVADACEMMLKDSTAFETLANENPGLAQNLLNWLKHFIEHLKAAFADVDVDSVEAEAMIGDMERIQKLWDAALVQAVRNTKENVQSGVQGEVQNSLRYNDQYMKEAERFNEEVFEKTGKKNVDDLILQAAKDTRKEVEKKLKKLEKKLNLPTDREGNTLFKNGSYNYSAENSTICIRSLIQDAFAAYVEKKIGRKLTIREGIMLSQKVGALTGTPQCAYCFVGAERMNYDEALGKFLDNRDIIFDSYEKGLTYDEALDRMLAGRKPTDPMKERAQFWYDLAKEGKADECLSREQLAGVQYSDESIAEGKAKLTNDIQRKEYDWATDYARSASHAKKRVAYVAYNNNILDLNTLTEEDINMLNNEFGLRMYSYSDYSPAFVLENMQMVTDAAVRGLKMLAYTKELDFVRIFAPTGMNINISIFAYQQNGQIAEDSMQGAAWAEARALREQYPNVGITLVATNDDIVKYGMEQDWVDVVLPFHSSFSGGTKIAKMPEFNWTNYTNETEDKLIRAAFPNKEVPEDYPKQIYPPMHNNDLIMYAKACIQYNFDPRFKRWINQWDEYKAGAISDDEFRAANPYYMKLVNETRQSAGQTAPVQPIFGQDAALDSIQYLADHGGYNPPIMGDLAIQEEFGDQFADEIVNSQHKDRTSGNALGDEYERYQRRAVITEETLEGWLDYWASTNPNYAKAYIAYINPMQFLNLTTTDAMSERRIRLQEAGNYTVPNVIEASRMKGIRLWIDTETGEVVGHEGRHRMVGLDRAGITAVPILLVDESNKYSKVPIDKLTLYGQKNSGINSNAEVALNNVQPLSRGNVDTVREMFVTQTKDEQRKDKVGFPQAQFKDRTNAPTSREILSTALVDIAENDAEKSKLKEYQKNLDELNDIQKRVTELGKQIYDISFTKGSDRSNLSNLQKEKAQLEQELTKYDKKLLNLQNTKPLKDLLEREKKRVSRETKAQTFKDIRRRDSTASLRRNINEAVTTWQKQIDHPTQKNHIVDDLVKTVADMVSVIDLTTNRTSDTALERIALIKAKCDALRRDPDYKNDLAGDPAYAHVMKMLENLMDIVVDDNGESVRVYDMDYEQLTALYSTIKAMQQVIRDAKKTKSKAYKQEISETGKALILETLDANPLLKNEKMSDIVQWQLDPELFFARMGGHKKNSVWQTQVAKSFTDGTLSKLRVLRDFENQMESFKNSRELNRLTNPRYRVDIGLVTNKGETVELTRGQMLSVYMVLGEEDGKIGFLYGGLSKPNDKHYYGGHVDKAYGVGSVFVSAKGRAGALRSMANNSEELRDARNKLKELRDNRENISEEKYREESTKLIKEIQDIKKLQEQLEDAALDELEAVRQNIYSMMTETERKFVEAVAEWYNTKAKDYANEVTMELFGYKGAQVANYYPIHRNRDFIGSITAAGESDDFSLVNSGFMKERVRSSAPIYLTDIVYELDQSVRSLSNYYGYAIAQRDFDKIYKVKKGDETVASTVANKFGEGKSNGFGVSAAQYIKNLEGDIAGGRDKPISWTSMIRRNLPRGSLTLNLRVALSQAASLPTAAAEVGWGAMLKGLGRSLPTILSKSAKVELAQKSELFFQRYKGEGGMREFAEMKGGNNALDRLWNWADRVTKHALLNWCQNVDVATTYTMWKMAEVWVEENTDLKGAEFDAAVKEKYEDIIRRTQPNYTTTERSDLLRETREAYKFLTMYKTQSNKNFNILYNANATLRKYQSDFKNGKNGVTAEDVKWAKRKFVNAYTALFIGATPMFVLMRVFADFVMGALKDYRDDKDELTRVSVFQNALKQGINTVAGMFVFGSQLSDALYAAITKTKYNGIEDSSLRAIREAGEQAVDIGQKLLDGKATGKDFLKTFQKACTLAGLPFNSVYNNIIMGLFHHIQDIKNGEFLSYEAGVTRSKKVNYQRLLQALENGDEAKAEKVRAELRKNDPDIEYSEIKSGLTSQIKSMWEDGLYTEEAAQERLQRYTDRDANEAYWKVQEWINKSGDADASTSAFYRVYKLIDSDADATGAIEELVTHGKGDTLYGNIKDHIKEEYEDGNINEQQARDRLLKYGKHKNDGKYVEYTKEDVNKMVTSWETNKNLGWDYSDKDTLYASGDISKSDLKAALMGKEGLTSEEADKRIERYEWADEGYQVDADQYDTIIGVYNKDIKKTGISKEIWYNYYVFKSKTTADKDKDGNSISGTKMAKVFKYIGGLPLTKAQKDALAHTYSQNEKSIAKYKTW